MATISATITHRLAPMWQISTEMTSAIRPSQRCTSR